MVLVLHSKVTVFVAKYQTINLSSDACFAFLKLMEFINLSFTTRSASNEVHKCIAVLVFFKGTYVTLLHALLSGQSSHGEGVRAHHRVIDTFLRAGAKFSAPQTQSSIDQQSPSCLPGCVYTCVYIYICFPVLQECGLFAPGFVSSMKSH